MLETQKTLSKSFSQEYCIAPKRSEAVNDEMALSEHIEEFSQRFIFCLCLLTFSTLVCFTDIKEIVKIFQAPAIGIKFLQFAPGEYFFASLKIAAFCGLLLSSPLIIYQIFLYILVPCNCILRFVLLNHSKIVYDHRKSSFHIPYVQNRDILSLNHTSLYTGSSTALS